MSHGAIRLNTDPVSLPPHNGQSGNHKIPLDTLWSLQEVVLPIASTLGTSHNLSWRGDGGEIGGPSI